MANKPKPYAVQLIEASMQARLRNLLVERNRLEALCNKQGVAYRDPFLTAAEVAETRAEHDAEIKAFAISMHDPQSNRIAALAHAALTNPTARRDWADTVAAADIIVKAKRNRR